jgi:hypothetical protein
MSGPRGGGGTGVAEELYLPQLNLLQSGGVAAGFGGVWAGMLGLGDGCIVDLDWACGNSIDIPWWLAGEGVCHCIALSLVNSAR